MVECIFGWKEGCGFCPLSLTLNTLMLLQDKVHDEHGQYLQQTQPVLLCMWPFGYCFKTD